MAGVTVEINGKETVSTAAAKASDSIAGMGQKSKPVFDGLTITAGDVANAIRAIASTVADLYTEFAAQERAILTFNAAMQQAGGFTDESVRALREYAEVQALRTGADDEAVLGMVSFLATAGRTEGQIRGIISAASDMSVVTGKDLRTAVEEINKTFSGTEGRMGQVVLGLNDLTEAELQNGAAVDVIAAQYAGLADQLSGSSSVAIDNAINAFDDLRAAIGGQMAEMVTPALREITGFINEKLLPIIQNLPEVMRLTFDLIGTIIKNTLSWEGLSATFTAIGQGISKAFQSAFEFMPAFLKTVLELMMDMLGRFGEYAFDLIKNLFTGKGAQSPGDFLSTEMAVASATIAALGKASAEYIAGQVRNIGTVGAAILSVSKSDIAAYQNAMAALMSGGGAGAAGGGSRIGGPQIEDGTTGAARMFSGFPSKPDLPAWMFPTAGYGMPATGGALSEDSATGGIFAGLFESVDKALTKYVEGKGEAGGASAGRPAFGSFDLGIGAPWMSALAPIFESVAGLFGNILGPLSSVQALLHPLVTFLGAVMEVIGPLVNQALAPLVGIIKIVGNALGQILAPVILAIGKVINWVAEGIIWVWNGIVKAINWALGWAGVKLSEATLSSATSAGMGSDTSGGVGASGGAAAQYARPRDLTLYVTVNTSALVGGDGINEFALLIGRELKASGLLGVS